MMPTQINLQELADMPGFGAAKAALQQAGQWDENAGSGPERLYVVTVEASSPIKAAIHVKARTKKEAEEKAEELIDQGRVDWEVEAGDPDIEFLDVTEPKEVR